MSDHLTLRSVLSSHTELLERLLREKKVDPNLSFDPTGDYSYSHKMDTSTSSYMSGITRYSRSSIEVWS